MQCFLCGMVGSLLWAYLLLLPFFFLVHKMPIRSRNKMNMWEDREACLHLSKPWLSKAHEDASQSPRQRSYCCKRSSGENKKQRDQLFVMKFILNTHIQNFTEHSAGDVGTKMNGKYALFSKGTHDLMEETHRYILGHSPCWHVLSMLCWGGPGQRNLCTLV